MEICLFLKIGYSFNSIFQRNNVGNGASVITGSLLVPFCGNQCLWKYFHASSPVIVFFLTDHGVHRKPRQRLWECQTVCVPGGEMPDG